MSRTPNVSEVRYPTNAVAEIIASKEKTFELIVPNDRPYSKKDQVVVQGFEPSTWDYSGDIITGEIVKIETWAEDDRFFKMRIKKIDQSE